MTLLDLHIIRAALYDARRLVEAGYTPEAATSHACRGAWEKHREYVLFALVNCVAVPPPTAPHYIRRGFLNHHRKSATPQHEALSYAL